MKKQPDISPILTHPDTPANLTLQELALLIKKTILGRCALPPDAVRRLPFRWQTVFKAVLASHTTSRKYIALWKTIDHWEDVQQVTDAVNQTDPDQPHDHIIDRLFEVPAVLTADQLQATSFPQPAWLIPDILPVGLAVLWGPPKSGKTFLALQFARALAAGEEIFSHQTHPGKVLYLALDEPPAALQERLRLQDWPEGLDVDFLTLGNFHHAIGGLYADGVENLVRHIKRHTYRLIIIDTLTRALLGGPTEPRLLNLLLAPLHEIAHTANAAILLIDHLRANAHLRPDPLRDIALPLSRFQVADTGLGLYPLRINKEAHLWGVGRRVPQTALHLRFRDGLWSYLGDVPQDKPDFLTFRERQIIDLFTDHDQLSGKEAAELLDTDASNTYRRLKRLASHGLLDRSTQEGRIYYRLPCRDGVSPSSSPVGPAHLHPP